MVKPSKSMQPEHVDLQQASKRSGKGAAFGEDSFRNYMALKIANQRQQFGLVLPPPPPPTGSSESTPLVSKVKSPPQKQEGGAVGFKTHQKPTSSIFPTPTTRLAQADWANRMSAQRMKRNSASGKVAPSLNQTTDSTSGALSVKKRLTLSERSSLAPFSQMAYPMTGESPSKANRTKSDGTNKDCTSSDRSVRFAEDIATEDAATRREKKRAKPKPKTKMESVISRLKKRHGRGNRRLERTNAKKRKVEGHSNQIEGGEEINIKMDLPPEPADKEDGLLELEKLFAMADEKNLEIRSNNDERKNEDKTFRAQRTEVKPSTTKTAASTIAAEEGKSALMVEYSLAELDRIFATAETANDDDSPPSFHRHESEDGGQDIPLKQKDSLTELDRMFAAAETANDDDSSSSFHRHESEDGGQDISEKQQDNLIEPDRLFLKSEVGTDDASPFHLKNSESRESKHYISEQQQDSLTELDRIFSTTGAANDDDSPFYFDNENSGEICQDVPGQQIRDTIAAMASDSPAVENESEESSEAEESSMLTATTASNATLSPKSIRRLRPDLFFYGVVVKIAGYTHPDNETIKRLLQKHGGDLETYETERVTHIIAQQLSMAKANVYKKARKPRPVCRPSWIMDSVREGKLLPHEKYLLIEERDQQQMGIQGMFQKRTEVSRQQPPKTSSTPSSPQKSSGIHNNPYAKKNKSLQSPNKRNGNLSSLYEAPQLSPVNHGRSNNLGILTSPNKTDKEFIYGKLRTVGTDPNFLDSYFASSRLSFIGSFKQRTPSTHYSNDTEPSPLFSNSKKLIFHVDMDCFFASVVLRNLPQYQDKPVVISHHGNRNNKEHNNVPKNSSSECATCNYEARKYGIKKGMFLGQAKELCPELIVLMYDFEGYEEVSQQVLKILDRLATSEDYRGVVETVSCDEAYVELNFNASEKSDKLYDHAYQIAESIRNDIFDTTRCTASIGVGVNKFLAKLGTDKAKPNKSYCVRDYRELLKSLKLRDMHGVGRRTEKKLVEESLVTVQDVWGLGSRGEAELIRILGPGTGKKIFRFTQGKDDRPITPVERKTIGAECNYGVRFDGPYGIDHFMEGLAKEVEKRMKGISMKGKKLTLKIKQRKEGASNKHKFLGHGSCHNLSKSIGISGNTATRDAKLFAKIGLSLFREFAIVDIHEIRGMGITISNLENDGDTGKQTNISGMQYWLHQRNELGIVKNSGTTEEALRFKEFITEETTDTNCSLLSTPKLGEKLEVEIGDVVRNEESPLVIELPPISQIQMSQVDALPSELRQQVRSRMKTASAGCIGEENIDGNAEDKSTERANTSKRFVGEGYPNANNMLLSTPEAIGQIGNEVQKDTDREVLKNVESPLLIKLPPMSQIRMTQVEALPPELQQQIYSRMNGMITGVIEKEIVDMTADAQPINRVVAKEQVAESEEQHSVNRFRQTDLKRMMKLAAVRSGHESTSISLTQLEQLPLEIKLQVVNRDDRQIGVLSQHVHRPASFNDRPPRKSTSNTANDTGDTSSKPKRTVLNHAKNAKARKKTSYANSMMDPTTAVKNKSLPQKPRREFQIIERVDVWKEDLLPLKEFLNDNCPLRYPNSIGMVLEFLSIVLKEGRLPAMVTMIRCIRNRKDGWSKIEIIEKIARTMNDLHIERYGATLDVGWLMGMEE